MTSPNQIEIVADHVEDAREKGARILTGGKRKDQPGDWYEPTVIADADHSMKVMRDETFGPVIPVMKVSDTDEAVRMANDTRYGLGASVFAGSAEAESGSRGGSRPAPWPSTTCSTNYSVLGLPMGGWKNSGIGYRHGASGSASSAARSRSSRPGSSRASATRSGSRTSARKRQIVRASPACSTPAA